MQEAFSLGVYHPYFSLQDEGRVLYHQGSFHSFLRASHW